MRTPLVAVVGSRTFNDAEFLKEKLEEVRQMIGDFVVVSGGAPGADSLAAQWCVDNGGYPIIYPAFWYYLDAPDAVIKVNKNGKKYDARAGFRRNQQIVDESDFVIAFWDGSSPGTKDTIRRAEEAGKFVYVCWKKE